MRRDLDALIGRLTLDEKVGLLAGADMWSTRAIERIGLRSVTLTDGPNGARGPALPGEEAAESLDTVCYPSGSALGATWDPELVEAVGAAIAREARAKGCRVLLGPTVNLHRSPLGGRNFESYSEDPLLSGRLGAAWIRGAQQAGVACTVKHFAGNETEHDRMLLDAIIDERTLRELHLLPFEIAVKEGGALGVMTAYNRLNGEHCADNRWLVTEVLRRQWAFAGFVVSDWFAFASTAAAIEAGLDLEMPGPGRAYGHALVDAVRSGAVHERLVDAAVLRLLSVLDRLGAFDADADPAPPVDRVAHAELARSVATSAIVMLRNEGILPLDPGTARRVAVVGPNADRAVIMGGGSASLAVSELRTPFEAIRNSLPHTVDVVWEPGVDIALTTPAIPGEWLDHDGEQGMLVECFGPEGAHVVHTEQVSDGTITWFGTPKTASPTFRWRARATLTVPTPGRWTLSLVQTEPTTVVVDDRVVIDGTLAEQPTGTEFFGQGQREQIVDIDLTPDQPVTIELRSEVRRPRIIQGAKIGLRPSIGADAMDRAVEAARTADQVIIVAGTDADWETEGHDRDDLNLPGGQDELIERILDVAPDAVVVVNSGSVVALPWAHRSRALLQCWFGGIEMADALVDVVFGRAEPGGRLPTSIPQRLEDNPTVGNFPGEGGEIRYGERVLVGYRWYQARNIGVAYPFGFGLSYTDFSIGPPELSSPTFAPGETLAVRVPVTNTGARRGSEVVQLYVAPRSTEAFRPPKELKAFAKVLLDAGQTTVVEMELDARAFARWGGTDPAYRALIDRQSRDAAWTSPPSSVHDPGWIIDEGRYDLHVGRSSDDTAHSVEVTVTAGWLAP